MSGTMMEKKMSSASRLLPRKFFRRLKMSKMELFKNLKKSTTVDFEADVSEATATDGKRKLRDRPTLVGCGENAGDSRVVYRGHNLPLHLITRDFFITLVSMNTALLFSLVGLMYLFLFLFWSFIWWLITKFYSGCLVGSTSYVESLTFAAITQMTIGYGNTNPGDCWVASWLVIIQSIFGVIVEAVVIGIVFARISHPAQRARSIFLSNKAVIGRRDGILKFMFRVADIRTTQVVEPRIKVYLYTWGDGRVTAEGERIPVRVEPLQVDYIDGQLLLPLIIEHTVDERSPLCGHTHDSLVALNAEIVVTFEGTTEAGNPFMARRSYVPEEIYWGYKFCNILSKPPTQSGQYEVSLDRFHKVERHNDLPAGHPSHISNLVVGRAKRTVPYPLLGENTLVLSDLLCVCPDERGRLCLFCRVGDTYPGQMIEIEIKMYLFRWKDPLDQPGADPALRSRNADPRPAPFGEPYEEHVLECGYEDGSDRLYLRLPTLVRHVIDDESPLSPWLDEGGMDKDIRSEICVIINAYKNYDNSNVLRQRTYAVDHHVKYGYGFVPMIRHPALARDRKPRVRWQHFHDVQTAQGMENFPNPPNFPTRAGAAGGNGPIIRTMSSAPGLTIAPESHAGMRNIAGRQGVVLAGVSSGVLLDNVAANLSDNIRPSLQETRNETTMLSHDLNRYAAAIGADSFKVWGKDSPSAIAKQLVSDGKKGDIRWLDKDGFEGEMPDSMDADTSLPYPAALHPSLPGRDRFRVEDETDYSLNDYTVSATDLHRYSVAIAQRDDEKIISNPGTMPVLKEDEKNGSSIEHNNVDVHYTEEPMGSAPSNERMNMDQLPKGTPSDDLGPLTGFHPLEQSASSAAIVEDEEQGAGPMHFATGRQRGRPAKSLAEISSLFAGDRDSGQNKDDESDIEK